jgi:hypothetical protein
VQALAAQIPAVHDWLQQSVYDWHTEPDVLHFPAGTGAFVRAALASPFSGRFVLLAAPES